MEASPADTAVAMSLTGRRRQHGRDGPAAPALVLAYRAAHVPRIRRA